MNLDPVRSIAALSSRWRNRFSRSKELPEHLRRGVRGEKLACRFLRNHGYKILYRNFRDPTGGEIDIVCRNGNTLVFVEVKRAVAKSLAARSKQLIDKSNYGSRKAALPGSGCSTIRISIFVLISWKFYCRRRAIRGLS